MSSLTFQKDAHNRYDALIDGASVAWARYRENGNYISMLHVLPAYRRQGIAIALVRFIQADRGAPLNRAPNMIKNDAIRRLSARLGEELLEEASDFLEEKTTQSTP